MLILLLHCRSLYLYESECYDMHIKSVIYTQTDGVTMGSLVDPTLPEFFMLT